MRVSNLEMPYVSKHHLDFLKYEAEPERRAQATRALGEMEAARRAGKGTKGEGKEELV